VSDSRLRAWIVVHETANGREDSYEL